MYLVKVPFEIAGQSYKPGDLVHQDGPVKNFVNDLLKSEVIAPSTASPVEAAKAVTEALEEKGR